MNFCFSVEQDKIFGGKCVMNAGNVNYYQCIFDFSADWNNLIKFAVFIKNDEKYSIKLLNGKCCVPMELLIAPGYITVGVYASNGQADDYLRISSNTVSIYVSDGAYAEGAELEIPTPDVWEQYIKELEDMLNHSIPRIGENGNWELWNVEEKTYVDSGKPSRGVQGEKGDKGEQGEMGLKGDVGERGEKGEKGDTGERGIQGEKGDKGNDGYTPVKGKDYFTDDDIESLGINKKADKKASIPHTIISKILLFLLIILPMKS